MFKIFYYLIVKKNNDYTKSTTAVKNMIQVYAYFDFTNELHSVSLSSK